MSAELCRLPLSTLKKGLKERQFSCVELAQDLLKPERREGRNMYITDLSEDVLKKAHEAQKRYDAGTDRPLEGMVIAVKDNFCTQGIRTTAASAMLQNFVPPYESTITGRLWQSGAILSGKTNMDEFAMGVSNETSFFGPVVSPIHRLGSSEPLVPGGSSGGSAAVLAAGAACAALGSDTGGSVRQPASFCGVFGFKPSYGVCSRYGMVAFASSLDQVGFFTRSAEDAAVLLEITAGPDGYDMTLQRQPFQAKSLDCIDPQTLRIGIPREADDEKGLDPAVRSLWKNTAHKLEQAGFSVREVSFPYYSESLAVYYVIAPAEALSNLARYDGVRYGMRDFGASNLEEMYCRTRSQFFGAEVKRRLLVGARVLSKEYFESCFVKAQSVRRLLYQHFTNLFSSVDVLLTPTTLSVPFAIGAQQDPITAYRNDLYTVSSSLAGLPAASVPLGHTRDGLPLGIQVIASHLRDDIVLKLSSFLEKNCVSREVIG